MGSKAGVLKIAAKRLGMSLEEYTAHINAGEKWCYKGEHWKPLTVFALDRTRGDGHKAVCQDCDYTRIKTNPGKKERQEKHLLGLAYCSKCEDWLPTAEVHRGMCRMHINQGARDRYNSDARYKSERKQHAHARKRNIKPIPPVGQEGILEQFAGKCAYCGNDASTWDHVYPIAVGGITTPSNIVPACMTCNSSKGDRDVFKWMEATGKVPSIEFFERLNLSECSPFYVYEFPEM